MNSHVIGESSGLGCGGESGGITAHVVIANKLEVQFGKSRA